MSFQKIKSSTSRCFDISTAALHIIAMLFMLMDHLWATLLPAQEWLTCVGRIAFPIFAFMSVEGYFHTHNFKKYLLRMLVFAVISEIPFDLMYGGTWFYPVHQNVIWTFVLGLLGIHIMETVRKKKKTPVFVLTAILVTIAGGLLGTLTMVDYYGIGVLTVFIFYFFRGRKWWCLLGQIAALYWVNVELLGGLMYPVRLFGVEFELCQQGLALLALVPIWLYRGRQGYHSKPFQYFCYAFYPVHMLILVLILGFVMELGGLVTAALILYASVIVFQIITLPVELNASGRGLEMLESGGYISYDQRGDAKAVLRAAAMTYIVAALSTLVSFLRLLMIANNSRRRN